MTKTVIMFPGQGSQEVGMGAELFEKYHDYEGQADVLLGYSIKTLCTIDPEKELDETQYTQVALYVVNAMTYRAYREDGGTQPDFLMGHSLGEYNALLAADVFSFIDGLRIVQKRAQLMSQIKEGGMLAVIGLSFKQVEKLLLDQALPQLDIANINTAEQIILSGPAEDLDKIAIVIKKMKKYAIKLKTSGAFHSRYMQPAQKTFDEFLQQFTFRSPSIPVISNYTADTYTQEKICDYLVAQLVSPVRWFESVQLILRQNHVTFAEIGSGNVLSKLLDKIMASRQPS